MKKKCCNWHKNHEQHNKQNVYFKTKISAARSIVHNVILNQVQCITHTVAKYFCCSTFFQVSHLQCTTIGTDWIFESVSIAFQKSTILHALSGIPLSGHALKWKCRMCLCCVPLILKNVKILFLNNNVSIKSST